MAPRVPLMLVLLCAGCNVFDASLLDDAGFDAGDAEADGDVEAGPDADTCGSRRAPERPERTDSGDMRLVRVLIEPDLDQGTGTWADIGYDLDGRCSRSPSFDVECVPPPPFDPEDDGEDGVDNSFGHRLLPGLVVLGLDPAAVRARIATGVGALIVEIEGYDGEDDDPRVRVTVSHSALGHAAAPGDPTPTSVPTDITAPAFDGNDYFYPGDADFLGGDPEMPRFFDDGAFVRDGIVTIHVPNRYPLVLASEQRALVLALTDAVLTVPVEGEGLAMLGGRWPVEEALDSAKYLGFCPGTLSYDRIQTALDQRADVRAVPGTGGEDINCDAASLGVSYVVKRGRIAPIAPTPPLPTTCSE